MLLLYKQFTLGALLFVMDGTGGTAVVWDRWSQRAGDQLHVTAVGSPVHLTGPEVAMLVTHAPLAILGLTIIAALAWHKRRQPEAGGDYEALA
jgi:surfactin synthase thioesterase subunit